MKISAVPSAQNSVTQDSGVAVRSMKMNTMATPGSIEEAPAPAAQELPISDTNEAKTEATQPLSPHFAEIARKRRALQLERRAFEEEKKAILAKATGSGGIDVARLKSEPLSVLQEAGVTYDQLTEALLANQEDAKVRALEAKIKALEEGVEKKFTENELRAEQQVLAEMRREAEGLIAQGDSYELVRETKSIPDVMTLIERTYKETGEVLDVSEALKLVEDHLFNEMNRLAGLNKIKSQFVQQQPPEQPQPQQQTGMRTLKNKDTASIALSRKARALAAWTNYNK